MLGIQGVVLLLLYQIFITGINAKNNMQLLWPSIPRPDFINTQFLGLNLAEHSAMLAGIVAGYVFAELMIVYWLEKRQPSRKEQIFTILFPAFIFLALALLPSVKSIFVLTSLVVSSIISLFTSLIKLSLDKAKQG